MAKERKFSPPGGTGKGPVRRFAVALAAACVWAFIALLGLLAYYAYDLPDIASAMAATRRPTVRVLAGDGAHLMTVGDIQGAAVTLAELPPALPAAVLATEDRRFYEHFGLDVIGLARAAFANLKAGRIVQGGSTISQQAAKNLFLNAERTLKRKVQELLLALWLERKLSKDQILTIYLNRVYLGAGTYGVEAAARRYFQKPARNLSTYEAAMLAGLLKAPSRYNPAADPERAHARARQVLANMVAFGSLGAADAAKAERRRSEARPIRTPPRSRYFADWILSRIADYIGEPDTDIVVTTTLNRRLQADAEAAVAWALKAGAAVGARQGAALALAPDGAVRAMVGGADYGQSQFNRATQALRQPGSAFKPLVFLAGLEAGMTPGTVFEDKPITIDGWSPRNFKRTYQGRMTLEHALAASVNTVAVRVAEKTGRGRVIDTARRLGITADLDNAPSLALGTSGISMLELTAAYAVFAGGGLGVWPYGIESIADAEGNVLYRRQGSGPGRVVAERDAANINAMLAGVIEHGTGKAARIGRPAAGKTGTSQNFRDAWFVGYSADLVAAVWLGNDDGAAMQGVTGGGLPARAWARFMTAAHAETPPRPLPGVAVAPAPAAPRPSPQAPADKPEGGFWKRLLGNLFGKKTP